MSPRSRAASRSSSSRAVATAASCRGCRSDGREATRERAMRILIPGITGQLGRLVAQQLDDAGHEVIGIDRRPWYGAPKRVQIYQVDIRKRGAEDVFRKHRPEAVVHMATVTHVFNKSDDRYRINLGGTRAVFDHSVKYGVRQVLFVGRHPFYGAGADSPLYHTENEPPIASSPFP